MAQDTSGIMGLQEDYFSKGMLPPEMGLEVADGTMKNLDPNLLSATDRLTSEISGQLAELSDEELDIFIQLVEQLYNEPENYAENRANLIKGGDLTEEDLPPDYQPEALAMILYVLRKEKQARSGGMSAQPPSSMPPMAGAAPAEMQPPQGFARGGIAEAARIVAGSGRNGDTMLAHITPREAKLLRKHGGSGTINPVTGLREYGLFSFLRDLWQAVWKPVKKFLNTSVGKIVSRIALNVVLPGYGEIIYAGLQGAAQDKSFGDIVKNMAIAGVTQYLGGQIPGVQSPIQGFSDKIAGVFGIDSVVGKQAFLQGAVNTGMGLAQGQDLKEAATSGLMAAGTVVASDYLKNTFTPKGEVGPDGKVTGNRFTNDSNAMQDAYGPDAGVGGRAPVVDKSTFSPPTNAPLDNPSSLIPAGSPAATTSTVAPPVTNANTSVTGPAPANAGTSTTAPYKPVTVGEATSTMGRGIKQIFTGDVSKGFDTLGEGASDLFMPSSPTADQLSMRQQQLMANNPKLTATQAMDLAQKEAPGMLRTYGPAAAAGLGIMAMAGGFDTPTDPNYNPNGPQFRGPTGEDLINADPNKYRVNFGQSPYATLKDIQVATNYTTPVRYADGGEVGEPEYLAEGGIAYLASGGAARVNPNYRGPMNRAPEPAPEPAYRAEYRQLTQSLTPAAREYLANNSPSGIVATTQMLRDAMAYSAQQAARQAPASDRNPGAENTYYAANPEQYRPNMQQPQYASGGSININNLRDNINLSNSSAGLTAEEFKRREEERKKKAGIAALAMGGYPRKTGQISGPGTETSDSIPAMLSDGEFVMTARAVRGLGKGSRREGAKRMYALMHQLERNAARG